jgi:chemotaxis response regulator CheB
MDNGDGPEAERPYIVAIGVSAGGITALQTILQALPGDFPATVLIVQHRSPEARGASQRSSGASRRCP